jgi:RHH-type transcriptional regulator, proline utilization regulon repressor / proline dehydrogenase / delta 1-pyrroline-5-carboxylate dehydrogenase
MRWIGCWRDWRWFLVSAVDIPPGHDISPMLPVSSDSLIYPDTRRRKIQQSFLTQDNIAIQQLFTVSEVLGEGSDSAVKLACELVRQVRERRVKSRGLDALLNEYALSTDEGVILMGLAEALMRIPDRATVDELLKDKLGRGRWESHLGNSQSRFVNASAWGLAVGSRLIRCEPGAGTNLGGVVKSLLSRVGMPVVRTAVKTGVRMISDQFVFSEQIEDALEKASSSKCRKARFSFDMLGEGARCQADADRYYDRYHHALQTVAGKYRETDPVSAPGISIKLSALHPRYQFSQRRRVMEELVPRVRSLAKLAAESGIGLTIDAEEADRLDLSLDVFRQVFESAELTDWQGFGMAVQAYQKRAPQVIDFLYHLASAKGRKIAVRLVKGAYWDTEIKRAQIQGLQHYPVFTSKAATDISYLGCAWKLLQYRCWIFPQFATHNAHTIAWILSQARSGDCFELQRLYGMGKELHELVHERFGTRSRIYAPVGERRDLLAYLARRLLENGANTSFVSSLVNGQIAVEDLCQDPVLAYRTSSGTNTTVPPPAELYGNSRRNSSGFDLADGIELDALQKGLKSAWLSPGERKGDGIQVRNPARLSDVVGLIRAYDSIADMEQKLVASVRGFESWRTAPLSERAALLRALSDQIEKHRDYLVMLCIREGGKTLMDALAEVREAVDFCRYYAAQAAQVLVAGDCQPRGIIVSISPWNFPLAILTGQLCAALVSGNSVILKPAEQTPLIAMELVMLLRRAGLPENVVEIVISPGGAAGEKLIPDPRVAGVMFTGSTETARWIYAQLARRPDFPLPFIAETGGMNAMIVDSTALIEQVVDDVIRSGYNGAGQRCSSLRVLFLQREIAPAIIETLAGAMAELVIGDPADIRTDIGPVIDMAARQRLERHIEFLEMRGSLLYRCQLPGDLPEGFYFAPALYRIPDLSILQREVFGPIVHVIEYDQRHLDQVIDAINATSYGLTLGIHSRIEGRADYIARRVQVGNVYVNRDMIGAVVGVQPFGGRRLSGTGPKAGGPYMLDALLFDPRGVTPYSFQVEQYFLSGEPAEGTSWKAMTPIERLQRIVSIRGNMESQTISAMLEWCAEHGQLANFAEKLCAVPDLPGPTGEDNELILEPRGTFVCVFSTEKPVVQQVQAMLCALIAGNSVKVVFLRCQQIAVKPLITTLIQLRAPVEYQHMADSPETLSSLLKVPRLGGVIADIESKPLLLPLLVEREGEVVPLIIGAVGRSNLHQMVQEKVITVNTTAIGGNAALMSRRG